MVAAIDVDAVENAILETGGRGGSVKIKSQGWMKIKEN